MQIPADAVIPLEKLTRYLLKPRPWDDKSKFLAQAGFSLNDPDSLEEAIRRTAANFDASEDGTNDYGTFFRVDGSLVGPTGHSLQVVLILVTMEVGWDVPFRHSQTAKGIAVSQPTLYERVALSRDLDEHGLKRGDVATVVDSAPHPTGGPDGVVLEVTNALGDSLQVVIVTPADIEPLSADEVLSVRQRANIA